MHEELRIRVIIEGRFGEEIAMAIAPLSLDMAEVLTPLKVSDGPFPFFDTPAPVIQRVKAMRNFTVARLAPEVAKVLIEAMGAKDTVNGYTKAEMRELSDKRGRDGQ